jgi:anti-sigma B factor antagonist
MAALTLAVERLAAATVLSCHGALVAASAMQLETALSQALLRPELRIVVDLAAVAAGRARPPHPPSPARPAPPSTAPA